MPPTPSFERVPYARTIPSHMSPHKSSFAERRAALETLPQLVEGDDLMRGITRAPPGDARHRAKSVGRSELAKKKSNYFEEAFSLRDSNLTRDRTQHDSVVMAELRTNVIVGDEFVFITELSYKLAERYQRPVSSIVVNIQHSGCMLFGGTFEPAYIMHLFALPTQLQPATNRRNVFLLSEHLEEALGVPATRGLIRFVPLQEENVAFNGKTVAQAVDETESSMSAIDEENSAALGRSRVKAKRLSVRSFATFKPPAANEITPPTSADDGPQMTPVPGTPTEERPETVKVARRRKSFISTVFSSRSASKKEKVAAPTSGMP